MKQELSIIKVGGAVVEHPDSLTAFLSTFADIPGLKILVHGGGRSATAMSEQLGIETQMVEGRRITDAKTLRVVTMVYGGLVNKNIVAELQARGINALGLTGADLNLLHAHRRPPKNGIDYGFVGDVDMVNTDMLDMLLGRNIVPVLSPLTFDGEGSLLNTNADTIAAETAKAMASEYDVSLIYCFEKHGVLENADDDRSVIPLITPERYEQIKANGTISGGMLPKMDNAFAALHAGVKRVIITNAENIFHGTTVTL